jgi:hypothetical protein
MITIKELKEYLGNLPEEFDEFVMVNGEVSPLIDGEYYVRVDKSVIQLHIDEENKEFVLSHQTQEEVDGVIDNVNGDTEEDKG